RCCIAPGSRGSLEAGGGRGGPAGDLGTEEASKGLPALIVHRFVPDRRFVTDAQGIPVTNVSRTLMDLAGVVEAEPLERALDYAIRLQMTSVLQLRWGIARLLGPGRRGVGVLSRLLDDRGPGSVPSVTDFQGRVRKLLAGAGLEAVEEYEIR